MPEPEPIRALIEAGIREAMRRHGKSSSLRRITLVTINEDQTVCRDCIDVAKCLASLAHASARQEQGECGGPCQEATDSPIRQDILRVLGQTDRPLKGRAIAGRCGRAFTSHFRGVLSRLRKDEKIKLLDKGYWPADRPEPPEGTDQQADTSG